jgi:hypothetical protein
LTLVIIIIIINGHRQAICKEKRRKEGGRGLVQVEAAYKAEIINIAEYLNKNYKKDQFVNTAKQHESTQTNMNSIIK